MKIAINTRHLIKDRLDGIGWFSYESLKRITRKHSEHQFFFIFDRPYSDEFIFSSNITPVVIPPQTRHPILWYWWFEYSVPRILKKNNIDLFLSPDGFLSLSTDITSLPVIHDINFIHRSNDFPCLAGKYYRHYFPLFARKGKRIATVSEYSKKDISNSYSIAPYKIDVVFNGANSDYSPLKRDEKDRTRKKYTGGNDYFVFIGTLQPRKNITGLLLAFDEFRKCYSSNFKLVIVGEKMFKTNEIKKIYSKMVYKDDVIFMNRLSPGKLRFILGAAAALIFVSFFEGFGIPILEAMFCETPVITSNVTSMPEVSGDAALLVDPFSVGSIKNGMLEIIKNPRLKNQLIKNSRKQREKFNWDKTAENLWNSIEKCFGDDKG